eukprot:14792392-Ditylum_brightwellii.AAC.1
MTGHLQICRQLQSQTLRKIHQDQHWELGGGYVVKFIGQDDKAKVPVGDKVHVATGVRSKHKAI